MLASLLLIGSASPARQSTDAPWQGQVQSGDTQQLRALIAKGERAKAANPVFLDDLRKLGDAFDSQWPTRPLYDDFRDGDFTSNPGWTVTAGTWRVDQQGRLPGLQSRVVMAQSTSGTQSGSNAQNAVVGILGALLQQQQGGQTQQQAQDQDAAICTPVAISNSFAIRLEIASRQPAGRFDFGPYLGPRGDSGYYLTYVPAMANSLVLSVTSRAGSKQLAGSNGPVRLEDGASHVIDWKRDRAGKMTVALDGKVVIEATDLTIRRPFEGFLLANSGGNYSIHSVTINGGR